MCQRACLFVLVTACFSLLSCKKDDDGPDGDEPDAAVPGPDAAVGTNRVGEGCASAADCEPGLTICNDDPGGQCTADCSAPADCDGIQGAVCESDRPGHCYKECTSKADCPRDGYDCVGGPNPEGKKWCDINGVGGACYTVSDCTTGLTICNDDPGGQCTADCTTQADCDGIDGAVCETDRPGHCYKECTSKADCPRDGYDCVGGPNPEGKMWCDVI